MALTQLKTHEHCTVDAQLIKSGPHYARLYCCDCEKHIQWLTWWDYLKIKELNKE